MSAVRSPRTNAPAGAPRRLRADAQRNRDAILSAAREVFDTDGVLASLDGIALRAGVGNATLYRNFPTREDLLAAVMEASIAAAVAEGEDLARTRTPRDALAEWLRRLTWHLRTWHDLPYCLATARADQDSPVAATTSPLLSQTAALLDRAKVSGDALQDVTAEEVFELVTALSWGVDRFGDDEPAARKRVALATAGIFSPGSRQDV